MTSTDTDTPKRRLARALRDAGVIDREFSGSIRIDMSSGGIRTIVKESVVRIT